ncbi:uncharacterized protein LOC105210558 isoform X1 [Zeugodacus cucurbitae]|uniref:uncharacterized protein LOC105210558 isoform X1 n=1 Tax=Zeugodacus cucurbitae TaxID=28588 RepID=UPI0023D9053B|nr:uncharacterized protein LOC105210558 isoform X1 [Zeugodacus cucurbitae]
MSQRRVLKVSYHGNRQLIRYKKGSTYNEILKTIMKHFQIPCKRKSALILKLTNEAGKVFSKRQLTNYLSLFPTPKITFHLQNSKESTASSGKHLRVLPRNHKTIKTSITKQHRRQKRQHVSDYVYDPTYPTAAVFRMNCFVGVYPSKCAPPPVKRVRFSESSNSIRIIPARSLTPEPVKGALRRTNSFVGEYPQLLET